ncbi:MAG TPA: class I SAM-dependent methyltransferase [Vicinamibacteria bacterium]|nr:class I SAM-dependent methyltransferase [Vicinamibacteria bacterium]
MRCLECASVYQDPRVDEDDLPACYASGYFTHDLAGTEGAHDVVAPDSSRGRMRRAILHAADGSPAEGLPRAERWLGLVLAQSPSLRRRARYGLADSLGTRGGEAARCLEVGPGRGLDLLQLRRIGWQAHGLEMDAEAAAGARTVSGCEVRVGTLTSTDYAPGSFQLIYMNHVLEHLPRLEASLARCLELLAPDGRLFAAYPNLRALTASFYGRHSCVWDPPRHLTVPEPRALLELLRRLGFVRTHAWTSAARAAAYRRASLRHAHGQKGFASDSAGPTLGDRAFAALERGLTLFGAPVGEEVFVIAHRPGA